MHIRSTRTFISREQARRLMKDHGWQPHVHEPVRVVVEDQDERYEANKQRPTAMRFAQQEW